MAVHLVTGYKGAEHIQSADQGSFNAACFGAGEYVMDRGNKISASITSNSTVRISDGDILMQGRHIRINTKDFQDVTIDSGTPGINRNDLIVMEYSKDATTGVETATIKVIKGTETSGTASDPTYTSGNILSGALLNQMPLYRVNVRGVSLESVDKLFSTVPTFQHLAEYYKAEFVNACKTYLDSLNIIDTLSEITSNTQPNQLTGGLATRELKTEMDDLFNVTFNDIQKNVSDIIYILNIIESNIYHSIKVNTVTSDKVSLSPNAYVKTEIECPDMEGYYPMGVLGYQITNGSDGKGNSNINVYMCFMSYNCVDVTVRNTSTSKAAEVYFKVNVLYVRDDLR